MLYHENRARSKGFKFIVGVDEAGRGPLAGPVVAAAVLVVKRVFNERIDDSKRLSPTQREKAFFEISKNCLISIGIVDNVEIDRINILNATIKAMEQAVLGLGVRPDCALIDGNIKLKLPFYQKCVIRGDSKSLSIAAASIIAKVTRDSMMREFDKMYPAYGFRQHKGYGTRAHVSLIKNFGPCPLHRRSFRWQKET